MVTDQTGRRINVPERPERLVSLAPSVTEIVFALGLGDSLVGDSEYCNYPPEAKQKPRVGGLLNPSIEKIVALRPDLVLATPEANRVETAHQLERVGIPVYGVRARTVEETLESIRQLGVVLGREMVAQRLVAQLRARVHAVEQSVSGRPRPKVLFVVWYRPLITAGPDTFIADVIRRAGGISLGDTLRGDWPRLSLEDMVRRDPDILLLPRTESFFPTFDELRALPGWRDLRAVNKGHLYVVSEAVTVPSPRLIDALEEVARILHPEAHAQEEARR